MAAMCWLEGCEAWRANIPTAYAISGRVAIMRYMSWPTVDWKVRTRLRFCSSLGLGFGMRSSAGRTVLCSLTSP